MYMYSISPGHDAHMYTIIAATVLFLVLLSNTREKKKSKIRNITVAGCCCYCWCDCCYYEDKASALLPCHIQHLKIAAGLQTGHGGRCCADHDALFDRHEGKSS